MNDLFKKNWNEIFYNLFWKKISPIFSFIRLSRNSNKLPIIKGKEVVIVGTSPNLDISKLNSIEDSTISIGLHRVHDFYDKTNWRPNLLFIGDELLFRKKSKTLLNRQDKKTRIVLGSSFFVPFNKNKISYIKLEDIRNKILNNKNLVLNSYKYFSGRSVVLLAMQYCIKQNVNKITLTGVDFNYDKGYFNNQTNNIGLNEPEPLIAKRQLIAYIDICKKIGISVEHPFNENDFSKH